MEHNPKEMKRVLMLVMNEAINELAMVNSVHWCGYVLRECGHVMIKE